MSFEPLPPLPEVPMVSVLSLTYNHERFVAESVESVLAQDWPADRLQYVILNDGSTDGTSRVLDAYRDDPRVTVIEQENQGMLPSLDTVIERLTGDVICGCAGDDAMLPGRFERLVEALRANPAAGIACSDLEVIDDDGRLVAPSLFDATLIPRVSGRVRGRLLGRNVLPGGGAMLRGCLKPLIHPIPSYVAWEDYWWAWAVSGVAEIVHVPVPTYRYRQHADNMSLGISGERLAAAMSEELPFRRFMLSDVAAGEATAEELLDGVRGLWRLANVASEKGRHALVPSPQQRAEGRAWIERAVAAERDGDRDAAALACCRAASLDPMSAALVALVRDLAFPPPASGQRPDRAVLDELGARRFAVLADAGLLLTRPELLRAWGEAFGAEDDATLVIHGAGEDWERLAAEVPQLVVACGLDGEQAPDMVFTTESPERLSAIAAAADAALGLDLFDAGLIAFDVEDVPALPLLMRRQPAADGAGA